MSASTELYELLPVVIRRRDAEQGSPLRALLDVIAEQAAVIERDIAQLYDNWFIETCEDWAIPYIGELIGETPPAAPADADQPAPALVPPRRAVAQALHQRRRAGVPAQIVQSAEAATSWPARLVEYAPLVGVTQALNHPRPTRGRLANLRKPATAGHTADMRRAGSAHTPGRYNPTNLGLLAWRMRTYPVMCAPAYFHEGGGHHCYTFSALGNDLPLFCAPAAGLPMPISRRMLHEHPDHYYGTGQSIRIWRCDDHGELVPVPIEQIVSADLSNWQEYRPVRGTVAIDPELGRIAFSPRDPQPNGVWVAYRYSFSADMGGGAYARPGRQLPILAISRFHAGDLLDPVGLADRLQAAADPLSRELRRHCTPAALSRIDGHNSAAPPNDALLGALLGALNSALADEQLYAAERFRNIPLTDEIRQLAAQQPQGRSLARLNRLLLEAGYPAQIAISYRRYVVGARQPAALAAHALGGPDVQPYPVEQQHHFARLDLAIEQWRRERPRHAVIEITDHEIYPGYENGRPLTIALGAQQQLTIRAAPGARPMIRLLDYAANRPDCMRVIGQAGSRFRLEGLIVTGQGIQCSGELAEAVISHCTLVPGWALRSNGAPTQPDGASLELFDTGAHLVVEHSIVGPIQVNANEVDRDPASISIADSIVDAGGPVGEAIGAPTWPPAHAALTIVRSTILGRVTAHSLDLAENSLFLGGVTIRRRQAGCVRYCYVPPGSQIPTRYRCQPDQVAQRPERMRPRFASTRYGDPRYCRLADDCAPEIARGASDGAELGAFHELYQAQCAAALRALLDQHTPDGMSIGIVYLS